MAKGEEDLFWQTYLGINDKELPRANELYYTEWDKKIEEEKKAKGELPSDFYSTTPRMDLVIQATADTLGLNKLIRNYDIVS